MWDPYAEFKKVVLSNGLTIYKAFWPNCPAENVRFLIHAGAEQDPIGLEGLAHFVEHTVLSSVDDFSIKDIKNFFEDCGGSVKLGFVNFQSSFYGFSAPVSEKILSKSFSIFGERLISGKLLNRIEEERGAIIREFSGNYPTDYSFELATQRKSVLYPVSHYLNKRASVLGDLDSIKRIKKEDLQSFHDKYYNPANISIVCVGGLTFNKIVDLISASPFAIKKEGKRISDLPSLEEVEPLPENRILIKSSDYIKEKINHCSYQSLVKIPISKTSSRAVSVFSDMLGIILSEEIRSKKGWAYSIVVDFNKLRDLYEFEIKCNAFNLDVKDAFVSVIEELISSLPLEKDLFERIINREIAGDLTREYVSGKVCEGAMRDIIHNNRIISIKEEHENLNKLAIKDIENLLYWFRPEFRLTQLVIP